MNRPATSMVNDPGWKGAIARFWLVRGHPGRFSSASDTDITQRSYASDYLGLAILITAYILVRSPTTWSLDSRTDRPTPAPYVRLTVPSHVLARQPGYTIPTRRGGKSISVYVNGSPRVRKQVTDNVGSLAVHIRWVGPTGNSHSMGNDLSPWNTQDARYNSGLLRKVRNV
jgi:hypothetical protein